MDRIKKVISLILIIAFLNFIISPYLVDTDIKVNIHLSEIIEKTLDFLLLTKEANASTEPPCNNVNDENTPGIQPWNALTAGGVNLSNGNFSRIVRDLNIPGRGLPLNIIRTYNSQPVNLVAAWIPEAGSWGIENNEYSGEGDRSISVGTWSDFTLELKMKTITPGDTLDYETGWINFRYIDKNNRYYFLIHTTGEIELSKFLDSTRYNLVWKSTSYNPLNWNTVKIETYGGNIKIYINGNLEINYTDTDPIAEGKIALESYFSHVHYDDISITGEPDYTSDFNQETEQEKSIFGYGWTFTYGMKVIEYADGYIIFYRPDGGVNVYTPKPDGGYTPPVGIYDTLTKHSSGYTIRDKNGIKFNFDQYGRLINIQDRNNNETTLTYEGLADTSLSSNSNSPLQVTPTPTFHTFYIVKKIIADLPRHDIFKPTTITDASGRQITFTYGENGKVSYIADPAGRRIYYEYDTSGNLIKVIDPKGNFFTYTYYPNHDIKTWTDREGNTFTNTYYYNDRVATQTDPLGNITTITYDWEQTTVTNQKGEAFLYTFDNKDRFYWVKDPFGDIEGQAWDDRNNLIGVDDKNGHRTTYEYDQNGNQTKIIRKGTGEYEDLATQVTYEYTYNQPLDGTDPLGNKTEFEYDPRGNLLKTIKYLNSSPVITQMTYDSNGDLLSITDAKNNTTTFECDDYGNKVSATDLLGNTTTFGYDILGRLLSSTDPDGNTITYEYDSTNNFIAITNALDHQVVNTYDKNGAVASTTGPNGNTITSEYDALDNLVKATDPLNSIVVYEYDATNYLYNGQIYQTQVTDALGNVTTYQYDSLGRRIRTIDALGNTTDYEYDTVGNPTKVIDALGNAISFEYDIFYRKTKLIDPLGRSSTYTYDDVGNVLSATDANGQTTTYEYDTLYRCVKVIDPQSNVTTYSYDVLGNLTSVVDAYSNESTMQYDALSRKISMDDPDMGYWTYEYDTLGNLIRQADAKGQVLIFEYDDELNRLTTKKGLLPTETSPTALATYTYDDPLIPNSKGKLTKVTDPSGPTVFYYDKLGREIKTEKTIDGTTYTVERTYDESGRLTSIKYPDDGETVNYTYDAIGSIKTIIGNQAYVSNVDYTPIGQMKTLTYGNNTKAEYEYYKDFRLKELKTTQLSTGQLLQRLFYNFDNIGNVTAITDYVNTATQVFEYDSLDRLISANGSYGIQTYQYDPIGNIVSKDGVNYFYGQDNSKPHALTSGSDGFFAEYDENGNMAKKNSTTFEYDIENRLKSVKKEAGERTTVSMQLDPGWNLFSLPVIPDNSKISAILSNLSFGADYDPTRKIQYPDQNLSILFWRTSI